MIHLLTYKKQKNTERCKTRSTEGISAYCSLRSQNPLVLLLLLCSLEALPEESLIYAFYLNNAKMSDKGNQM